MQFSPLYQTHTCFCTCKKGTKEGGKLTHGFPIIHFSRCIEINSSWSVWGERDGKTPKTPTSEKKITQHTSSKTMHHLSLRPKEPSPVEIWKLLPSSSTMSTQNAARVLAECLQSPAIELNYRAVHPSTGSNFLCRWISLFSKDFSKRSLTQLLMARPGKVFLRTLLLIHFKFLMQTS